MSTFGYRNELGKYEELDDDELLATLTSDELQELERELADIDPDDNVPIGLRQKDQTTKTPMGTFSREALLKYWEDETRKLLEDEQSESCPEQDSMEEGQPDKSEEECVTESDSDVKESEDNEEENKCQNGGGECQDKEEDGLTKDNDEEEKKDECKHEPMLTSGRQEQNVVEGLSRSSEDKSRSIGLRTANKDHNLKVTPDRPCGNPIVIDEALEMIFNDDPTMSEVNLNNIEDISQETLVHFAEALSANTHVRVFSLANTHADDRVAFAISKMLRENRSITNLNIESNFVSGRGILDLLASLQKNGTLVELRFHNQRHICGGQVEMEMVCLLRENTTLLKLGYQFDLSGPRMTATSILTRNQDLQRQRRLQQQREQSQLEAPIQPGLSSANISPKKSPGSSPTLNDQIQNNIPPPPPPPPLPVVKPEKHMPTRKITEMIKQHEGSNGTKGQKDEKKKPKSKRGKNGANERESSDILKELKNALKPSLQKKKNDSSWLIPKRSTRDDLMEAIRGSSIRSLKRVNLAQCPS